MNKLENKNRQNRVPLSPQQTEAQRFALGFFRIWMSEAQLNQDKIRLLRHKIGPNCPD